MPEKMHLSIVIKDAIHWTDNKIKGMLCDAETGNVLTPQEARDYLRSELEKGYTYLSACDNRKEDGSCAGHKS